MEINEEKKDQGKVVVTFAAIDPYIQKNIVAPTEKKSVGHDWVEWGDRNSYPAYLLGLAKSTPTLRSIITGSVDFVVGDEDTIVPLTEGLPAGKMNTRGDTIREQIHDLANDYFTYGGFALQVVRSISGEVVEVYYIDLRFLRSNKENTVFYYSEEWEKTSRKLVEYPAFYPFTRESWAALDVNARDRAASSILYVKNDRSQVYPFPLYGAAIKACEIERNIDDFHLNSIENSFASSMVVNFNSGQPAPEIKKEIERGLNEKFSGHQNAGRILVSWNDDATHRTTFDSPKVEDFGSRYDALSRWCRQQVFTSFRATPVIFGIPTDNNGFAADDYENAFRLYNRTSVRPVQALICDAYDRIYGQQGVLNIKPFSLEETQTETTVE